MLSRGENMELIDFEANRKWAKVPRNIQERIINNVIETESSQISIPLRSSLGVKLVIRGARLNQSIQYILYKNQRSLSIQR